MSILHLLKRLTLGENDEKDKLLGLGLFPNTTTNTTSTTYANSTEGLRCIKK